MSSELKVGMLFLVVLVLVITFTVFVTPDLRKKGDFQVMFPRVQRLKAGDPVTYNGVRVGNVSTVEPVLRDDGSPAVAVVFAVDAQRRPAVLVGHDTRYTIRQGILGGAELEILSSSGSPITPEATHQAAGAEPIGVDEALASVRRLVEENRTEVGAAIRSVRVAMDSFAKVSDELREAVSENRQQLKATIRNIGDAAGTIDDTVSENREQIRAAIANFNAAAAHISDVVAENRDEIKRLIARFSNAGTEVGDAAKEVREAVAENRPALKDTIDNAKTISDQIAAGKGSIGKLVMEDTAHDKLEGTLDSAQQRLEEIRPVTQGLSELKFIGGVAGGYNLRSEVNTGEIALRIEPRPWKFYEVGVVYRSAGKRSDIQTDDPDKLNVDFNLQLGWRWLRDDDHQRYTIGASAGLLESRIGGKAWWNLSDTLSLSVMGRQTQNTREPTDRRYEPGGVMLRAALNWTVWDRITMSAGVDDIAYKAGPWIGIRGELFDNDLRNLFAASSFMK